MHLSPAARLRHLTVAALLSGAGATILATSQPNDRAAVLSSGTLLIGTLSHSLSTASAVVGDPVEARLIHPVLLSDGGLVPVGTVVSGEVTYVHSGRHAHAAPELGLRFTSLQIDDHAYAITAARFHVHARTAVMAAGAHGGGRAVMGGSVRRPPPPSAALVRRGTAGAALGAGEAITADGSELVLPAGKRLRIRLVAPAQVRHPVARASTTTGS